MRHPESLARALDGDDFVTQYELLTRAVHDRELAIETDAVLTRELTACPAAPAVDWEQIRARAQRGQRARRWIERLAGAPSLRSVRRLLTAVAVLSSVAFALLLQDLWVLQQSESAQRGTVVLIVVAFALALLSAMALASRWTWEGVASVGGRLADMGSLALTAAVLIGIITMIDTRSASFHSFVSAGVTLRGSVAEGEPYEVEFATVPRSLRALSVTPGAKLRVRVIEPNGKVLYDGPWTRDEASTRMLPQNLPDGIRVEVLSDTATDVTLRVLTTEKRPETDGRVFRR